MADTTTTNFETTEAIETTTTTTVTDVTTTVADTTTSVSTDTTADTTVLETTTGVTTSAVAPKTGDIGGITGIVLAVALFVVAGSVAIGLKRGKNRG